MTKVSILTAVCMDLNQLKNMKRNEREKDGEEDRYGQLENFLCHA
jgi:hypothetical protein